MSDDPKAPKSLQDTLQSYVDLMLTDPGLTAASAAVVSSPIGEPPPPRSVSPERLPEADYPDQALTQRTVVERSVEVKTVQSLELPDRTLSALERKLVAERVKRLTDRFTTEAEPVQASPVAPVEKQTAPLVKQASVEVAPSLPADVPSTPAAAPPSVQASVSGRSTAAVAASPPASSGNLRAPAAIHQSVEPAQKRPTSDLKSTSPLVPPPPVAPTLPSLPADQGAVLPMQDHWCSNGRPQWAQGAFDCLFFSVAGLTLAVPLVELGSIYPINQELTSIFGQADWFMGLMPVGKTNLRMVNTPRVVMPERYQAGMVDKVRYVISIHGYDWGLAVDEVDKAITLKPEEVRWRTVRSKRPWLAGTVLDYMCALVDVQAMAEMFNQADRQRVQK